MNPKFARFLKETKQDQLQKERLERKKEREVLKQAKLAAKAEEKRLKQLAREEAKAEKLRIKLAKQEEKRLAREAKASAKSKATKKKGTNLVEDPTQTTSQGDLFSEPQNVSNETQTAPSPSSVLDDVTLDDTKAPELQEPIELEETNKISETFVEKGEEEKFLTSDTSTDDQDSEAEPKSLYQMFKEEGDYNWLKPDSLAAKGAFNLINKRLHPERHLAKGVAVLPIKGSSFEDKRINCLTFLSEIRAGESSGEIVLKPEPDNAFDPNALAVYDIQNNKMLGYIPKAHDINACYSKSLSEGKFCGGYMIDGKNSMLKGEENAMILIATGWI